MKHIHETLQPKENEDDFIKGIYLPAGGYPEFIKGPILDLFDFANLNETTLTILPLKNEHCLVFNQSYIDSIIKDNILATNIYRDQTLTYKINQVIYGPCLLFGYNAEFTQNYEHFKSVSNVYMNEIINRFNTL